MNKNLLANSLVVFFGGLIGTFVALMLAPYFWWIGCILGVGIGYLFTDFGDVRLAYRRVLRWKPDVKFWKVAVTSLYYFYCGPAGIVLIFAYVITCGLMFVPTSNTDSTRLTDLVGIAMTAIIFFTGFSVQALMLSFLFSKRSGFGNMRELSVLRKSYHKNNIWKFFLKFGFASQAFRLPWRQYALDMRLEISRISSEIWKVSHKFILAIHSAKRVVIAFDILIATAVGYFTSSILLGGILSFVFYYLHVELFAIQFLGATYPEKASSN